MLWKSLLFLTKTVFMINYKNQLRSTLNRMLIQHTICTDNDVDANTPASIDTKTLPITIIIATWYFYDIFPYEIKGDFIIHNGLPVNEHEQTSLRLYGRMGIELLGCQCSHIYK